MSKKGSRAGRVVSRLYKGKELDRVWVDEAQGFQHITANKLSGAIRAALGMYTPAIVRTEHGVQFI